MKTIQLLLIYFTTALGCAFSGIAISAPKIDPIRFSITTKAPQVAIDEEFTIDIKATLMNIPANTLYVFEGANSFRLKVILPAGFQQTGGSFSDFIGAELTATRPSVSYQIKGKFVAKESGGIFQLLRSHKNANNSSDYIEAGRLSFSMTEVEDGLQNNETARIDLTQSTLPLIPYLTIAQLRASADTSTAVFITDHGRAGIFKHNPSSSKADDGALVIVSSGKRYERVYEQAVNVQWFGANGDGVTDNTAIFQAILNRGDIRTIYFPKPAVSYRLKEMHIRSNKNLVIEEGTVFEGLGTLGLQERMVMMNAVQNISIKGYNVVFKDQKAKYTEGQERHIFTMLGVTNVVIEGVAANDSGGDGFLIGSSVLRKYSENVKLINVSADNNKRQGLSIISGKNIEIINPVFTNTNGVYPSAGIDIEPDRADEFLEGIRIVNPITKNNAGAGITILIDDFSGTDRVVDISISNHSDEGSFYGTYISKAAGAIAGSIVYQNPIWKNNLTSAFCVSNYSSAACPITVNDPTVIDCNVRGMPDPLFGSAFLIYREANEVGDANIGNVHIIRPKVHDTRSVKKIFSAVAFDDVSKKGSVKNCSLIDPIVFEGLDPVRYVHFAVLENFALSDKNQKLTFDVAQGNRLLTYGFFKRIFHNATSTGIRTISLNNIPANYPEITFEVRGPQILRLIPSATNNILPISSVNGRYIQSNTVGSSITLQKVTTNSWHVKQMVGTWTLQP